MDFSRDSEFPADLSPLAWVHEELRHSLDAVHKALRRSLREPDARHLGALGSEQNSQALHKAAGQLHQAAGVLSMVSEAAAAAVLRAAEQTVLRLAVTPAETDPASARAVERADFAVLAYLSKRLAGNKVNGLALFPVYRELQTLNAVERIHPADLWSHAWQWQVLPAEPVAQAVSATQLRSGFESALLKHMREPQASHAQLLSDLCTALVPHQADPQLQTLWQLAAAQFQAQAQGRLEADAYVKRLGSRLLAQLRAGERVDAAVTERLAQDLLFFCAHAGRPLSRAEAPRLAAVWEAWSLDPAAQGDYAKDHLGHIDPAWVGQAKRRVTQAKTSWSSAAENEAASLGLLDEQFAQVAESLQQLFPQGEVLGESLRRAAVATQRAGQAPESALAMEVATSLLYVEAALEDMAFDQAEQADRVRELARRVQSALHGEAPESLDAWMEELYRRVSDRQTLGSVVHELRSTLSGVEAIMERYFQDSTQRELLIPVPGQLSAMRGVFTVLGLDQPALACLRMRDELDGMTDTEVDASRPAARELFERLAGNLGALSMLIDMLSVQPKLAKRMFRFDEAAGRLEAVMGRRRTATPPQPAASADVAAPMPVSVPESAPAPLPAPDVPAPTPHPATPPDLALPSLVDAEAKAEASAPSSADEEMLAVFLEEAIEVLAEARQARQALGAALDRDGSDTEAVRVLRRAFHTLKGSARMVGLTAYCEAAWAGEQVFNQRLEAVEPWVDPALLGFTDEALETLGSWLSAIESGDADGFDPQALQHSADRLRQQGIWQPPASAGAGFSASAGPDTLPVPVLDEAVAWSPDLAGLPSMDVPSLDLPGLAAPDSDAAVNEAAPVLDLPPMLDDATWPGTPSPGPLDAGDEVLDLSLLDLALPGEEASAADLAALEPSALGELPEVNELSLDEAFADILADELAVDAPVSDSPLAEPAPADESMPEAPPHPVLTLVAGTAVSAPEQDAGPDSALMAAEEAERTKVVGPLRISIDTFNHFLNDADELSRRLCTSLAEWAMAGEAPVPPETQAWAQALAEQGTVVGFDSLTRLAQGLADALQHLAPAVAVAPVHADVLVQAADALRRALHQFAAGFLPETDEPLIQQLQALLALDPQPVRQLEVASESELPAAAVSVPQGSDADVAVPAAEPVDPMLLQVFMEEGQDLIALLQAALRDWRAQPSDTAAAQSCLRALHTFKGGARLTGAMPLGEAAHALESQVEALLQRPTLAPEDIRDLQDAADALVLAFESLAAGQPQAAVSAEAAPVDPVVAAAVEPLEPGESGESVEPADEAIASVAPERAPELSSPQASAPQIDWSRFGPDREAASLSSDSAGAAPQAQVRVRAAVLERMAAQAGEVGIRRARLESELGQLKSSLLDMDDNLGRLRSQLRELELQAEAQMGSQQEAERQAQVDFDPLEFDRYTRFQELTRLLAESVNDVATVQRTMQRQLQVGEDELAAQSRFTRELQDELLRCRMVEFDSLAERMHRVVRQAARECGKEVRLALVGADIELDRSVLERLAGSFEHLLRNSVTHGIESPEQRLAQGKPAEGCITVQLEQQAQEVLITVADDGAGLALSRIRERGLAQGLISADQALDETALMQLIFEPGFSTASSLTAMAGRGIGMDVVRSEVHTLGGQVLVSSEAGRGARVVLRVPLTTALTQVLELRYGDRTLSLPAGLVESVQQLPVDQLRAAQGTAQLTQATGPLPFYWLGALLQLSDVSELAAATAPVLIIRSGAQRLALLVDEVLGSQEVVVKPLGPQLMTLPGLAGISLLASGAVALIYNPVALATAYGAQAQQRMKAAGAAQAPVYTPAVDSTSAHGGEAPAPLVLVVDDSLTVRRVTQRLLEREGYRVVLAKDGLEAVECLNRPDLPAVVLTDIEMPRMDGFDLVRHMRADARLAGLPTIMITSRIAQKHRDLALQIGVHDYLGKPYDEDTLLKLIERYTPR